MLSAEAANVMKEVARFQVWFNDDAEGGVAYADVEADTEKYELCLLALVLYAFRQWLVMSRRYADITASLLSDTSCPPLDALCLLPRPSDERPQDFLRVIEKAAASEHPSSFIKLARALRPGCMHDFDVCEDAVRTSRQFNCVVANVGQSFPLQVGTAGFGVLGKGANYYAPASVLLLYHVLQEMTPASAQYRAELASCVALAADAWLSRRVSMRSQTDLAMDVVAGVLASRCKETA